MHIFKTAGSSVRLRIERSIDVRRITGVYTTSDLRSRVKGYVPEGDIRSTGAELYYGHFFYGLHDRLGVPPTYGTFLRDPIERALSHYRHFERFSTTGPRTLADHLAEQNTQLDNLMTRMISGHREVPFGEIQRPHLDAALENLNSFAFVGLASALEASMNTLSETLGVTIEPAPDVNVNFEPTSATDEDKQRLAELNWADLELYDLALQKVSDSGI